MSESTAELLDDDLWADLVVPPLPHGRFVELEGRGTVLVRDFGGPPGAPAVVLLHGWTATADLNWFRAYDPLGERYRVIAFDHRGHGTGLRSKKSFRLEDCADDAIDVCDQLGVDRFTAIGYSMGGPVAQLLWRRHRDRVNGLILCATAPFFAERREERLSFLGLTGLAAVARVTPEHTRNMLTDQFYLQRRAEIWEPWAVRETSRHDWRMLLEAGRAIGAFSSREWLPQVDVPTAVIMTMKDTVIPLHRQAQLFELIPDARAFRVDANHDAVVVHADQFNPLLMRAMRSVLERQ